MNTQEPGAQPDQELSANPAQNVPEQGRKLRVVSVLDAGTVFAALREFQLEGERTMLGLIRGQRRGS